MSTSPEMDRGLVKPSPETGFGRIGRARTQDPLRRVTPLAHVAERLRHVVVQGQRAPHVQELERPCRGPVTSLALGYFGTLRLVAEEAEWMDVEAAARYLDFHANTIYRLVREGRLPALRFPVRIRREDLDACLERCRIKPGELAHLNQYARGTQLSGRTSITKAGTPDRRFGPRIRSSAYDV